MGMPADRIKRYSILTETDEPQFRSPKRYSVDQKEIPTRKTNPETKVLSASTDVPSMHLIGSPLNDTLIARPKEEVFEEVKATAEAQTQPLPDGEYSIGGDKVLRISRGSAHITNKPQTL